MTEEKALTIIEAGAIAVEPPADIVERWHEQAKVLMDIVEKRGLFATVGGKKYLEVEAWETIGAFNRMTASTELLAPELDAEGNVIAVRAKATIWFGGQPVAHAEASCGMTEFPTQGKQGWGKRRAAESAAQTWAISKAYRGILSIIPVLAGYEPTPASEMVSPTPNQGEAPPRPARPPVTPSVRRTGDSWGEPPSPASHAGVIKGIQDMIGRAKSVRDLDAAADVMRKQHLDGNETLVAALADATIRIGEQPSQRPLTEGDD